MDVFLPQPPSFVKKNYEVYQVLDEGVESGLARLSNACPIVRSSLGSRSSLLEKAKGCISSFCDRLRTDICLFYLNDEIAMKYYKMKHSFNVGRDGLTQKGDWEVIMPQSPLCYIKPTEISIITSPTVHHRRQRRRVRRLNKVYTSRPSEAGLNAMTFAMAGWIPVFIPHALSQEDISTSKYAVSLSVKTWSFGYLNGEA
ncbi:hypothetical protein F5876DRAFT_80320 [Lentinula aff. lateritia]|uniref:Uncharacterized protein n=1 Tax=Lentinula aff. lateritia TaxID=2804960 RepID=A0ACC1TQ12_9AGAR|nr:hypothetical protein F5876DRAFT_80320 [Lentinula aff. lateritia]